MKTILFLFLGLALAANGEEPQPARVEPETGWSPQGLPLFSYSTDEGFGYGLRVLLVDHGTGEVQPYRYAITAQFYQTTKRIASHRLSLDAPRFLGSLNRIEMEAGWEIYKFFPYYGLGNSSTYQEQLDTCGNRDSLAVDPNVCPGNPAFKGLRYYRYNQETLPRIKLNLRRDLSGYWKLFAGYRFRLTRISPLYGSDDLGQQGTSQLILDAQAGKLTGFDGADPSQVFRRRTAELAGGLVYDGRDNEPAPTEGMFHELSLRGGLRPLGGQFNYWGANANLRFYHWLFPGYRHLVAALRVLFDVAGGEVPFFLLATTGGLSGPDGVGGDSTVRGLLADRLQGKVKALTNAELRWRFFSVPHFEFGVVAALDAGRVWAELGKPDSGPIRAGAAAGLRIAWNRNFVIRFDYGFGISEPYADGNIYLTFDEMF
jgi:hypothetical protein